MQTKTQQIFDANSPYDNPYQGKNPRWLFVCTAGLLRSPTGATMAAYHGINARSCGADQYLALIPLSANLIMWADRIIFVYPSCLDEALQTFGNQPNLVTKIKLATVLDIPDIYNYMDGELVQEFNKQLFNDYLW